MATDSWNRVDSPSLEYEEWLEDSRLPRSLVGGTRSMVSDKWLVRHPLETKAAYVLRLNQSVLFNAYLKTVHFLSGQIFQSNLIFSEDVSEDFKEQIGKCDVKGNDINVFVKRVFVNGLAKGVSHILVEAPNTGGAVLSRADEKALGLRPYLKEIRPEDVIGGTVGRRGNLQQIRIRETVRIPFGKYGSKLVFQIRVYNDDGTWELHRQSDKGEWLPVEEGQLSYPGIPIATFIPGEELSVYTGRTPMMDLAELNLTHFQSYSDQRNILSVARVPILFGRHIDLAEMPAGVAEMIVSDDDNADIHYVEIQGTAIAAGQKDIEDLEKKMGLWGLQQLIPHTAPRTATEKSLNSKESNSSLETWATEFERCLQSAFEIFEQMQGRQFPAGGIKANKEFSINGLNNDEGKILLEMKKNGILASENVFDEFQRRGVIHDSVSWQDVKALKAEDGMSEESSIAALAGNLFGATNNGQGK